MCALPIPSLMLPDAILWLWVPNLHLLDGSASTLLDAWGFAPISLLTWVKTDKAVMKERFGFGDWLRGATEQCIMAVRGQPVHELDNESTVIFAPMRAHSEKPDIFYSLVQKTCVAPPDGYLELFARKPRPGWVCWGDEVAKLETPV